MGRPFAAARHPGVSEAGTPLSVVAPKALPGTRVSALTSMALRMPPATPENRAAGRAVGQSAVKAASLGRMAGPSACGVAGPGFTGS